MNCPSCNKPLVEFTKDWTYTESGMNNVILKNLKVFKCNICGEILPVFPRVSDLHKAIARAIAWTALSLSKDERDFLKKQIGVPKFWTMRTYKTIKRVYVMQYKEEANDTRD